MSSSSDSEEFYDAEDNTPNRICRRTSSKSKRDSLILRSESEPCITNLKSLEDDGESKDDGNVVEVPAVPKPVEGRRRFRELRQKMQTEDDDAPVNTSPSDSQTSSVDGVYGATSKVSHPFRVIERDALSLHSISSLGRIGRILGSTTDPVTSNRELQNIRTSFSTLSTSSKESESAVGSKDNSQFPSTVTLSVSSVPIIEKIKVPTTLPLQEPDVIASTKNAIQSTSGMSGETSGSDYKPPEPVAPPRKKKKVKTSLSSPDSAVDSRSFFAHSPLSSPSSTIESITKELEHSLDFNHLIKKKSQSLEREKPKSGSSSSSSTMKSGHLNITQATKGEYVVKPQDEIVVKADGDRLDESENLGRLKKELLSLSNDYERPRKEIVGSNSVGRNSLQPSRNARLGVNNENSRDRRHSAGDEKLVRQLDMFVRTHTDSGKKLSDYEILEQVTVLNLDTGERLPLSVAEDKLPRCINPLSLHIMRLTSEYVSNSCLDKEKESDDESVSSKQSSIPLELGEDPTLEIGKVRKRTAKLKRFLGHTVKKTMDKAKSIAQEVSHSRHREDIVDKEREDGEEINPGEPNIKLKASNSHKGPYDLENIQQVQEFSGEHVGPVWCMKFSSCGRLLATAGQDKVLRIWVVQDAFQFFQDMRTKYNAEKVSPTPSQESLVSHHSAEDPNFPVLETLKSGEAQKTIFISKPFCTYVGHTSDLLDISWSKNYFILSSSMDKTVRLWHISRKECLCCFQHIDFVTAIVFHPRDDRYFLSGSLDGKLRLWNIPDKKVAVWNELEGQSKLITAANFCQNGKFAVVGSYDGRCIFYITDQLKYHTQIHVRSTRGKNSTGRKISGIEPMPGEDKILVTSNDSRIRLYDLRDLNLSCKYKGYVNVSSQIKASFSHDGKYIVSGSENRDIYVWKTHHDYSKFSSVRRDRNDFWEAIKAHNAVVTCAVFAPNPESIIKMFETQEVSVEGEQQGLKVEDPMVEQRTKGCGGYVLVSADFNGCIKVFINKMKPKHSSLPASALA